MAQISPASVASAQAMELLLQKFDTACSRALEKGDSAGCDRMAARHIKTILERLLKESNALDDVNLRKFMDLVWETCSRLGLVERFYTRQDSCAAFLSIMLHRALAVVDRAGDDSGLAWVIRGILDVYWQCEFTSAETLGADGVPFAEKPQPERHERAWQFMERLRTLKLARLAHLREENTRIRVAFLVHRPAFWQYEGIYRLMEADSAFETMIVVAPFPSATEAEQEHNATLCKERFGTTYNAKFFLDGFSYPALREEFKPDMVFLTDPWGAVCTSYSSVTVFDCVTCYSPYGIYSANIQGSQYNKIFHHFLDYDFCESPLHEQMARKYADNRGANSVVTGYAKLDTLFEGSGAVPDPWGMDREAKRIIWAPHFTIMENRHIQGYSCFVSIADFMLGLARQFAGKLQFAFKPHPNLKSTLCRHPLWGETRTEAYWNAWKEIPGCLVAETEYISLFRHSDAMILDSISFISEYMVTGKPILFTVRDASVKTKWNEYGFQAFKQCYLAENLEEDISRFLVNIVLENDDTLRAGRLDFVAKNLVPPNGKTASQNMLDFLLGEITPS